MILIRRAALWIIELATHGAAFNERRLVSEQPLTQLASAHIRPSQSPRQAVHCLIWVKRAHTLPIMIVRLLA